MYFKIINTTCHCLEKRVVFQENQHYLPLSGETGLISRESTLTATVWRNGLYFKIINTTCHCLKKWVLIQTTCHCLKKWVLFEKNLHYLPLSRETGLISRESTLTATVWRNGSYFMRIYSTCHCLEKRVLFHNTCHCLKKRVLFQENQHYLPLSGETGLISWESTLTATVWRNGSYFTLPATVWRNRSYFMRIHWIQKPRRVGRWGFISTHLSLIFFILTFNKYYILWLLVCLYPINVNNG